MGYCQISEVKIGIVIPARLGSMRLPRKPLLQFFGLEMIEHVRRRCVLALNEKLVAVSSPDIEILTLIDSYGGFTHKSQGSHQNGLTRAAEFSSQVDWSHFIIVQGDEILVLPEQIRTLIDFIKKNPNTDFVNLISPINQESEIHDLSVVKCSVRNDNTIIDVFRKSPLTCEVNSQISILKKITGLFAISACTLNFYSNTNAGIMEKQESIEQMRLIESGIPMKALLSNLNYPSVNVPADIDKVKYVLENDLSQKTCLLKII